MNTIGWGFAIFALGIGVAIGAFIAAFIYWNR